MSFWNRLFRGFLNFSFQASLRSVYMESNKFKMILSENGFISLYLQVFFCSSRSIFSRWRQNFLFTSLLGLFTDFFLLLYRYFCFRSVEAVIWLSKSMCWGDFSVFFFCFPKNFCITSITKDELINMFEDWTYHAGWTRLVIELATYALNESRGLSKRKLLIGLTPFLLVADPRSDNMLFFRSNFYILTLD